MQYTTIPQSQKTIESLWRLEKIILDTLDFNTVVQKIVDSTITELGYLELGYEIVVLCLINEQRQTLERISISQTEKAHTALEKSTVPFHQIAIPLNHPTNKLIEAIHKKEYFIVKEWRDILSPAFTDADAAQIQSELEIKSSLVLPIYTSNKPIGAIIFSMSKLEKDITPEEIDLIRSFTDIVGLAVQNAAVYTTLDETKKKLETANEELKELDKLKDEFVSVASHELKSPMNAVKNYLWLAQKKGDESPEKMHEYLGIAYAATQRLILLVNDLLNVSRIESDRVTLNIIPLSLKTLVDETIAVFAPQANEKKLGLTSTIDTTVMVMGDDAKVREILSNFISNAIKYTPTGSISITAISASNNQIKICVKDTGLGISPADQTKLFQKFSRVNSSYKELASVDGTGLGLYICKKFAELMGGEIGVESVPGSGSTFFFTLPISNA